MSLVLNNLALECFLISSFKHVHTLHDLPGATLDTISLSFSQIRTGDIENSHFEGNNKPKGLISFPVDKTYQNCLTEVVLMSGCTAKVFVKN